MQKRDEQYERRKESEIDKQAERMKNETLQAHTHAHAHTEKNGTGCERWCLCWLSFSLISYDFFSVAPMRNGMMCHIKSLVVWSTNTLPIVVGKEKEKENHFFAKPFTGKEESARAREGGERETIAN